MIDGLPLQSWILIVLAVGFGLGIELVFFFTHWKTPADAPDEDR